MGIANAGLRTPRLYVVEKVMSWPTLRRRCAAALTCVGGREGGREADTVGQVCVPYERIDVGYCCLACAPCACPLARSTELSPSSPPTYLRLRSFVPLLPSLLLRSSILLLTSPSIAPSVLCLDFCCAGAVSASCSACRLSRP